MKNSTSNIWDTPFLPPTPKNIKGEILEECLSNRIKGEWEFLDRQIGEIPSPHANSQDFNFNEIAQWKDVIVPSSLTMQGFDILNNVEYYYKRKVAVNQKALKDGLRVFIRFEGVYCNSRIWINNHFVTTHIGGFTPFVVELTDLVGKDGNCDLVVGISDIEGKSIGLWNKSGKPVSDASWASYYAHNNICGILRNVTIFYLPQSFILSNRILSGLTNNYNDGDFNSEMLIVSDNSIKIRILIEDKENNRVCDKTIEVGEEHSLDPSLYTNKHIINFDNFHYKNKSAKKSDITYSKDYIPFKKSQLKGNLYGISFHSVIEKVRIWTAEKPLLYHLTVILINEKTEICRYENNIGFRQIEYGVEGEENKVLINGKQVKLRGVCRHDVSYKYGRSLDKEEELSEILSYKQNNINHIRTSHYPVSKNYLDLCDKYGIYVELENGVCFKGSNGYKMHCSAEQIIQNLTEMIEFSYSHPSVIIWSIGNESGFEESIGFRLSYNYIKEQDKTRPVIFSYPYTVKTKPLPYDIYSKHYHKVELNTGNDKMPKLHDEFAHVACYNIADISRDNNYRIAWGASIKKGWERIYYDDGALGCAIWGGIDDVFYLPNRVSVVHQRHTASKAVGYGEWGAILDIYKREKPEAYLTKKAFSPVVINSYELLENKLILNISNRFDHTNINEVECKITVDGKIAYENKLDNCDISPRNSGRLEIPLSIDKGNIDIAFYHGGYEIEREIIEGVEKNIENMHTARLEIKAEGDCAVILAQGNEIARGPYLFIKSKKQKAILRKVVIETDKVIKIKEYYSLLKHATFYLRLCDDGVKITLECSRLLRQFLSDFGTGFDIDGDIKSVEWNKKTLYSYYPPQHLERQQGVAYRIADSINKYGEKPLHSWKDDCRNYFLNETIDAQRCTNDFMTNRTDILNYSVNYENKKLKVVALDEGINCMTVSSDSNEYIDCMSKQIRKAGLWRIMRKGKDKCCIVSRCKGSSLSYDFYGSGVKIYGTRSKKQGEIRILLDGRLVKTVSTRSDICDVLDFTVLEAIEGIPIAKHTLTLELVDNKGVRISGFETMGGKEIDTNAVLCVNRGRYYKSLGWGNWCGTKLKPAERKGMQFKLCVPNNE